MHFNFPSLISDRSRIPELFLLSYLQQYSEETRAETLLDGLWSIIDNDRNHGERLVGCFVGGFRSRHTSVFRSKRDYQLEHRS